MNNDEKPMVNPFVMLREEFDDWAILFDPDSGHGFGLSPTGVYLWKLLDGEHTIDEMLTALRRDAANVPNEADEHLVAFVEELTQHGLARYGGELIHKDGICLAPCPACVSEKVSDAVKFTYEPPKLVDLRLGNSAAHGSCCNGSSTPSDGCKNGADPYMYGCWSGYCTTAKCQSGTTASDQCNCGNSISYIGYSCGYGNCDALSCSPTGNSPHPQ